MEHEFLDKIKKNLNITDFNAMQQAVLELDLKKHPNILLISPTGSGKTLAIMLLLSRINRLKQNGKQFIVIVPSRELAIQTSDVVKAMKSELSCVCCYGGNIMKDEKNKLKENPNLIIGTPGRITDHLNQGTILPENIYTLVLDEFDKCLELGFRDELVEIFDRTVRNIKYMALLSATESEEALEQFGGIASFKVMNFKKKVDIEEHIVISPEKDKLETLYKLLLYIGNKKVIVFLNYREAVERTSKWLDTMHVKNASFHGGMLQIDREKNLYKFKNGSCNILVTTDLASRGLDITDVDAVVHYHLPLKKEIYTHRNGRTARWDKSGDAYSIIYKEEVRPEWMDGKISVTEIPEGLPALEEPQFATLYIGKGKKDKINKIDIVGFIIKKAGLCKEDVGLIVVKNDYSFVAIKKEKCEIVIKTFQKEKIKGVKTIIEVAR